MILPREQIEEVEIVRSWFIYYPVVCQYILSCDGVTVSEISIGSRVSPKKKLPSLIHSDL